MEERKTVVMQKGETFADIFDSPETIAQARRDGYSLVDVKDIKDTDINELTKNELIELAREKGVYEKGMEQRKKAEIIEKIQAAEPEKTDTPSREELIQAAIKRGFDEAALNALSDEELAKLPEKPEKQRPGILDRIFGG
jgi:hypothetical protein